jgi:hypothetical protein
MAEFQYTCARTLLSIVRMATSLVGHFTSI